MLLGVTFTQWVISIIFLFITMGIGGGLSLLAVRPNKKSIYKIKASLNIL